MRGTCAWLTRQWLDLRKTLTLQDQVSQDSGIGRDEGWGQDVFWEKTASPGSERAVSTFISQSQLWNSKDGGWGQAFCWQKLQDLILRAQIRANYQAQMKILMRLNISHITCYLGYLAHFIKLANIFQEGAQIKFWGGEGNFEFLWSNPYFKFFFPEVPKKVE